MGSDALPCFYNFLHDNGAIYLPNLENTRKVLEESHDKLQHFFDITLVNDPLENPLFKATELPEVNAELLKATCAVVNATQTPALNQVNFFIKLTKKDKRFTRSSFIPKRLTPGDTRRIIDIHVFIGPAAVGYNQAASFERALLESPFKGRSNVTKYTHIDIKNKKWGQREIFRWLSDCDMHVILCHMHQGIIKLITYI